MAAAPALTAGQGLLPELMAPGPDPGPGGDRPGGGPSRGQAESLPQALPSSFLPGTHPSPFCRPLNSQWLRLLAHLEQPHTEQVGTPDTVGEGGAFPVCQGQGELKTLSQICGQARLFPGGSHVSQTLRHPSFFSQTFGLWAQIDPAFLLLSPITPRHPRSLAGEEPGARSLTPGGLSLPIWALEAVT